jgi:gliding motility-associated-like protein
MRTISLLIVLTSCSFGLSAQKQEKVKDADTCQIRVPNAVTPNGDGMSRFYVLSNCPVKDMELVIYDRWGINLYSTSDFGKNGEVDWKYENVNEGVYLWIVKYKLSAGAVEEKRSHSGHVTVIR